MKPTHLFRWLLGIATLQLALAAAAGEHFAFTKSYLIQRNLEIPPTAILFPRGVRSNQHLVYGQLIFSNGAEFAGNSVKELPSSQIYCVVNAYRTEENQDAWEAKVPFRIQANTPYSAPLRRMGYGSSLQTLEILGSQVALVVACLRHIGEGQSQPLPITEANLRSAFGETAYWEIAHLPKDQPANSSSDIITVGGFETGLVAFGPAFPRPSVIVKGDTQIVRATGAITAGWLKIGSLKESLQTLAFEAGVSIITEGEIGITGRTVSWVVQGTQENVDRFNRLVQVFISANEPGSR